MKPQFLSFSSLIIPVLLSLSVLGYATTPIVTVKSPTVGSTDNSPVHFVASATSTKCSKGIAAMRIYVAPFTARYTVDAAKVDTTLSLIPGNYSAVVQAWDNCGGIGKTTINITVNNPNLHPARFLYLTQPAGVKGFTINPSTGALSPVAQGIVKTSAPTQVVSDSGGFRLYVGDGNKGLYAFFINRDNGNLTPVPDSPFNIPGGGFDIAVHPSGKLIFAAGNGVTVFKLNSNGSLTMVPGSPFPLKLSPTGLTVDPSGKYLYASETSYDINTGDGASYIDAYQIDEISGALTPVSGSPYEMTSANPSECGVGPEDIADAFGAHLYTADILESAVAGFSIEPSTGTLTKISGSPFNAICGDYGETQNLYNPESLTVLPTGDYLFGLNGSSDSVGIYAINAGNGALKFVGRTPGSFGGISSGSNFVRSDPSGKFIYAFGFTDNGNGNSVVVGFSVNHSTGALTPVPGSPLQIPSYGGTLTVTP